MNPFSKITFFFVFLVSGLNLQATFSAGAGGGITFYNNDFYLESEDRLSYKDMTNNVYGANLQAYFGVYLSKRFRLDLNQGYRPKVSILTKGYSFLTPDKEISFRSSLSTVNTGLSLIYEIPQDHKILGFIGLGVVRYMNFLSDWETKVKHLHEPDTKQLVAEGLSSAWSAKIIVGRSYLFKKNYFAELSLSFSFLEYVETSKNVIEIFPSSENTGIWDLTPAYRFPIRPLDVTINFRRKLGKS